MANLPPDTDNEELNQWLYELTQRVNARTGGEVSIDDQGRVTVDGFPVRYSRRYLDTAYATSRTGDNFTKDIRTLQSLTNEPNRWQGIRNITIPNRSNDPINFIWRQINVPPEGLSSLRAFYNVIGGRDIEWLFQADEPDNYLEDTGTGVIDLDNFVGAQGDPAVQVQITIRETNDITTDPTTWPISDEGQFFRNDDGDPKYLVATVFIGGVEQSMLAHLGYTYGWNKNGLPFTPSQGVANARFVVIIPSDVQNGGADQFGVTVDTND